MATVYAGEQVTELQNQTLGRRKPCLAFQDFNNLTTNTTINLNPHRLKPMEAQSMNKHKMLQRVSRTLAACLMVLGMIGMQNAFAQNTIFVSSTSGSDAFDGTNANVVGGGVGPLQTIEAAIAQVNNNADIISVEAGTYGENQVDFDKTFTLVVRPDGAFTAVILTNGLEVNGTVTFTGAGGQLQVGNGAAGAAVAGVDFLLTSGSINIATGNIVLLTDADVQRNAGAITGGTPTFGANTDVTYVNAAAVTAGAELPASIGTGALTINAAGTTTFPNALTMTTGTINRTGAGTATFNATVSAGTAANAITNNNGAGNMTFTQTVTFGEAAVGAANAAAGTLAFQDVVFAATGTGVGVQARQLTVAAGATLRVNGAITETVSSVANPDRTVGTVVNSGTTRLVGNAALQDVTNNNAASNFQSDNALTLSGFANNNNATAVMTFGGTTSIAGLFTNPGVANINGNTSIAGNFNNSNDVNLGANVSLTLSMTGGNFTQIGQIDGGTGTVIIGGSAAGGAAAGINDAADIAGNLTFSSNGAGSNSVNFTAGAAGLDVDGTFTVGTASTLGGNITTGPVVITGSNANFNFGAATLSTEGSFSVNSGTFNAAGAGATLAFTGTTADATFTPGPNGVFDNLTVNKNNRTVTFAQSVSVQSAFTVQAGTASLSNRQVRMNTAAGAVTVNGFTASDNTGGISFEAANQTYTGTGIVTNLFVNNGGVAVTVNGNARWSGTINLFDGGLNIAGDLSPNGSSAAINRTLSGTNTTIALGGGTFNNANVQYDLIYSGAIGAPMNTANEFDNDQIRDLTLAATGNRVTLGFGIAGPITINRNVTINQNANGEFIAQNYTIGGNLTVNSTSAGANQGTITSAAAGNTVTLNGAGATHTINGPVFATTANAAVSGHNLVVGNATTAPTVSSNTTTNQPGAGEIRTNVSVPANTMANFSGIDTITGTFTANAGSTVSMDLANEDAIAGLITLSGTLFTVADDINSAGGVNATAGTVAFGNNDIVVTGGNFAGAAGVTYTQGTGEVRMAGGANFGLSGASMANLEVDNATALSSASTITGILNLDNNITGANVLTMSGATDFANGTSVATGTVTGGSLTVASGGQGTITTFVFNPGANNTVTLASNGNGRVSLATTTMTHTSGTLALGLEDLQIGGAYTRAAGGFTATTASIATGNNGSANMRNDGVNGEVVFTGATNFTPGSGLTIPNVRIDAATTILGTNAFTVGNRLVFSANLVMGANNRLAVSDGATIIRDGVGTLSHTATLGNNLNLLYNTTAAFNTGNELPATVAEFEHRGANVLGLTSNVTTTNLDLNGAAGGINLAQGQANTLTVADGGTVEVGIANAIAGGSVSYAGAANLVYDGANATSDDEWPGAAPNGSVNVASLNITNAAVVVLHEGRQVAGNVTFNNGMTLGANNLNVMGNVATTGNNFATGAAGAGQFQFGGATNTTWTVADAAGNNSLDLTPGNRVDIRLMKTDDEAQVTITGGNVNLAGTHIGGAPNDGTGSDIIFDNGLLVTGTNSIQLDHTFNNATNLADQGYTRTNVNIAGGERSHIVGNIIKELDPNGGRFEFPSGTMPTSPAHYRPFALTFPVGTGNVPATQVTVNHQTTDPQGVNGLPIVDGVRQGVAITNYPNETGNSFFWLVRTSTNDIGPTTTFDVEAESQGYVQGRDFTNEAVEDIRLIRRFDGSAQTNEWVLQGSTANYDNAEQIDVADGTSIFPKVIVRNATGGLSTTGARFTYSQSNKAPEFQNAPATATIAEGATLTIDFDAIDEDAIIGQTISFSLPTAVTGAAIDATTGVLTYTPGFADAGTVNITVRATDSAGSSADHTVAVTVTETNQAPAFATDQQTAFDVAEGGTLTATISATDPDAGATLTYSLTGAPATASIDASTGALTYSPGFNEAGTVTFDVNVTDGTSSVSITLTITVGGTNQAPTFDAGSPTTATVAEGSTATADFNASDADGQTLTFGLGDGAPSFASIDASTGVVTLAPGFQDNGSYTISVTVSDGVTSASTTLSVTVTDVNAAPVFTVSLSDTTIAEGTTLMVTYVATDPDGDTVTYGYPTNFTAPEASTLNTESGMFKWTPLFSDQGTYILQVTATDGTNTVQTQAIVTVTDVTNVAPAFTATQETASITEGDTYAFTYAAADGNGFDVLTYTLANGPTGMTIDSATGAVSWATDNDDAGSYTFTVTVTDLGELTASTSTTLTVGNLNRAPVFTDVPDGGAASITENDTYTFDFNSTDADGDALTYWVGPATDNLSMTADTGILTFSPDETQAGDYAFTIWVRDGADTTSTSLNVAVAQFLRYGDPTLNGSISSLDASAVLRHAAGIELLTDPTALTAADVTGNGAISSFDASQILLFVAGSTTCFNADPNCTAKAGADVSFSNARLAWDEVQALPEDPTILEVPLTIDGTNVAAASLTANFDAEMAEYIGFEAQVPEGWMVIDNYAEGTLTVAMAGVELAEAGVIGVLRVRVADEFARVSVVGEGTVNENASSSLVADVSQVPTEFTLHSNYPNPFNPTTTIAYDLPQEAKVTVQVFNALGQMVRTLVSSEQKAGKYRLQWDSRSDAGNVVASGVYLYRIQAGSFVQTKKMLLVK